MRNPIVHIDGNIIFATSTRDIWAIFSVEMESYPGLTVNRQQEIFGRLYEFARRIEAPFWFSRVVREWSVEDYATSAWQTMNRRHGHPELFSAYLRDQVEALGEAPIYRPECYVAVRLNELDEDLSSIVTAGSIAAAMQGVARYLGFDASRALSRERIGRIQEAAERTRMRVCAYLDAEPTPSDVTEWLIRRSYTRGVAEPVCETNHRSRALILGADEEARYEPDDEHVLRFSDSVIEPKLHHLVVHSEAGVSYQAHLVPGAPPELRHFPGYESEMMFAPLDSLPFAVDATFSADWLSNREVIKEATKRKVDANQILREESAGEHGPSAEAMERPYIALSHEQEVRGPERMPMLHGNLILTVAASSKKELERRVEAVRAAYNQIPLFRPTGDQLALHVGTLPAQRFPLRDMRERLMLREFASMVPIACNHAGSDTGMYIADTASASRQPFRFSLSEASRMALPPTIILAGTLGSGKTMTLQTMLYQGFLQGSRIVDIDPKGDHRLGELPGVAEHLREIELSGSSRYKGLLDPLRIAEHDARMDMAVAFLTSLCSDPRQFETIIAESVKAVIEYCDRTGEVPTCTDVLFLLEDGGPDPSQPNGLNASDSTAAREAREAARVLALHHNTGLGQLGFATHDQDFADIGAEQVTSLRIRGLPLPDPNTPKEHIQSNERIGQAVLRLVAVFAMHLMNDGRTASRHTLRIVGEGGEIVSTHGDEASLRRALYSYVSENWEHAQRADDSLPAAVPAEIESAIDLYFGADGIDESWEAESGSVSQSRARRHKILGFDEAWFMLQDSQGRRLIDQLARWGRSEHATPILVTHMAADAESIDALVGARFVFRMSSEQEAARALELLHLDPDDPLRRRQVLDESGLVRGRCIGRDYFGRVVDLQIQPGAAILDALNTTPDDHAIEASDGLVAAS